MSFIISLEREGVGILIKVIFEFTPAGELIDLLFLEFFFFTHNFDCLDNSNSLKVKKLSIKMSKKRKYDESITSIHDAIELDKSDIVERLINQGIDVNTKKKRKLH